MESSGDITVGQALSNSGTLTIKSSSETTSGSLIVGGSSSGNMNYERYITGTKFHLIATPFAGHDIQNFLSSSSNNISIRESNYAMADYDENSDSWNSFFTASTSGNIPVGKGYILGRETDGVVVFTGTLSSSGVAIPITRNSMGWNLVGNPFPSAIGVTSSALSSDNFLAVNAYEDLDPNFAGLYLWDPVGDKYQVINNSGATNPAGTLSQDYLQAGQGFFIKSKTGGSTIDITAEMCIHQSGTTLLKSVKRPWPTIILLAESGQEKSSTIIAFDSEMTNGLDITYDAGMNKANPEFAPYSRLVVDNGVDFAIQCLPTDVNEFVIPIGLDANTGESVTLRAEFGNWFENGSVYLEDRAEGKTIRLDSLNSVYTFTTDHQKTGIGNFFLHSIVSVVGNIEPYTSNELFNITCNRSEGNIRIFAKVNQGSRARVIDLMGRIRLDKPLLNDYENILYIPELESGVYIVQVQNNKKVTVKKILW